jgi:hypothetical protein
VQCIMSSGYAVKLNEKRDSSPAGVSSLYLQNITFIVLDTVS